LPGSGGILPEIHQKPRYFDGFLWKTIKNHGIDTFSTGAPAVTAGDGDYLGFLIVLESASRSGQKALKIQWLH
jgi:hypothetical protein